MAISKSPTIKVDDQRNSAKQKTSTGSGARPGDSSRFTIPTSAPKEPHTLGRAPAGWLK